MPVNLTLTEIPVLPHCLGGHLPWSSGFELPRTKMSHRFTKRLLPLTRNLFFALVPAACARGSSRCFGAPAVRPLWEGLTREGLGSRPVPYVQPRRFMIGRVPRTTPWPEARRHAALFALRSRSVRPSHAPSAHHRPLHARPPSGPGHRCAEIFRIIGASREVPTIRSRVPAWLPRDRRTRW